MEGKEQLTLEVAAAAPWEAQNPESIRTTGPTSQPRSSQRLGDSLIFTVKPFRREEKASLFLNEP